MLLVLFFIITFHQISLTQSVKDADWHKEYHTLEEINQKLQEIDNTYENAFLFSIGKSYQNRDTKGIKFTGAFKADKPVIYIQCLVHAREWVSGTVCMYIADMLAQSYGQDQKVTELLDKMDFVIVPVINPDGYVYSWATKVTRSWRKNRIRLGIRGSEKCNFGVDLNRNYGYKWGCCIDQWHDNRCEDTWKGRYPFSQRETQNVRNYLTGLGGTLKGFIDFQAFGEDWYYPWRYTFEDTPDHQEQRRVAVEASKAIYKVNRRRSYTVHSAGTPGGTALAGGTSIDWVYGHLGVLYTYQVNLPRGGRDGYHLQKSSLLRNSKEVFAGLSAAVKAIKV
ncbi:carboxypeptidase B-like [Stylophora pistillata]|uniref:carboxypeptidase B-like n=1 Tax=Stylophora pistillata TaxID=50429 RepID=UPI000C05130E|nr:carboxypeptidase B-like [Stylophora pistillata]